MPAKALPKHYNGWEIVDRLWVHMPPLPYSNPGVEGLRCFAMKHLHQFYGKTESRLVEGNTALCDVRDLLAQGPRGYDCDTVIDQLRLAIMCNLANACRLIMVLDDLEKLLECYE